MPIDPSQPVGRELAAALHALSAPFVRRRAAPHIDLGRRAIDFGSLLAHPWSSSERALIETACTLSGGARTSPTPASAPPCTYSTTRTSNA